MLSVTPFYGESGGQVGDSGTLECGNEKINIINTIKENNLCIHITEKLPSNPSANFVATVNKVKRDQIQNNHTATHLLHKALREVLGTHVEQKGSLVSPDYLRFDFSHFQKVTIEEIDLVEQKVNAAIRANNSLEEQRHCPIEDAKKFGAMMLFGEKYGENVRVIKFNDSVELCGGTHVQATGNIGFFKITSESASAAGIRRIEAITANKAEEMVIEQQQTLRKISDLLKNQANLIKGIESLISENALLQKQIETVQKEQAAQLAKTLTDKIEVINGVSFIGANIQVDNAQIMKDIAFQLKTQVPNLLLVLGAEIDGKANLAVMVSDNLVSDKKLNANTIIREIAKNVDGGGGGQPFFATAGGKNPKGIDAALESGKKFI